MFIYIIILNLRIDDIIDRRLRFVNGLHYLPRRQKFRSAIHYKCYSGHYTDGLADERRTCDQEQTAEQRLLCNEFVWATEDENGTITYSEEENNAAREAMKAAAELVPDLPYVYFNLGNLYCLSSEHINSIENYTKAIELYPYMGDAYFNRGLVLIYLKDREKGCIDLSRAGELGVQDAYGVIKKYCEDENN